MLQFPVMSRTAVVVADAPGLELHRYPRFLAAADLVIAADGGARHLINAGHLPDLAIGDFDSLEPHLLAELQAREVAIEQHPVHKNETDLELALLRAVEQGATTITVLGALGGRPDQHLANLQLLLHPALRTVEVRLLDQEWEIFVIHSSVTITGQAGDLVSLLPMTDAVTGIRTEGLYYPLQDETLHLGPARGVSNVLLDGAATVAIRTGVLLAMHKVN